jgi:hypothetical protein
MEDAEGIIVLITRGRSIGRDLNSFIIAVLGAYASLSAMFGRRWRKESFPTPISIVGYSCDLGAGSST